MLELRPNCECCNKDLPPDAADACICTYECTFCSKCADEILSNVCPNCGGGFAPRPIRPKTEHRPGLSTQHQLASTQRVYTKYSREELAAFSDKLKDVLPINR